jgi:carbohydrate-binding DOMON domain-containing protein
MSTQYRLVQSGKTASGGCSAGQGSSEPVAPRIYFLLFLNARELQQLGNIQQVYLSK